MKHIQSKSFYRLLFNKTAIPIFTILGIGILYVFLMSVIDHSAFPFPSIILVLAVLKTALISFTTFRQLSKLIQICDSFGRLLWVFGVLIGITVFSFATDYACLYQFDHSSFQGVVSDSENYIFNLYHFFYFSVITFSTVGFGDLAPVSAIARFVVMLEILLSFFIIVFSLANIKKIHINE